MARLIIPVLIIYLGFGCFSYAEECKYAKYRTNTTAIVCKSEETLRSLVEPGSYPDSETLKRECKTSRKHQCLAVKDSSGEALHNIVFEVSLEDSVKYTEGKSTYFIFYREVEFLGETIE